MLDTIERLKSEPPADCHEHRDETKTSEQKANKDVNRPNVTPATAFRARRPPLLKSATVLQGLGHPSASGLASHKQSTDVLAASLPSHRLQAMLEEEGMRSSGGMDNLGMECSLCMEVFEDEGPMVPRNLQCGHTYCTGKLIGTLYEPIL